MNIPKSGDTTNDIESKICLHHLVNQSINAFDFDLI